MHLTELSSVYFFLALQDVEANTVRLEEHGKTVLVLEKRTEWAQQGGAGNSKWDNPYTHATIGFTTI